MLKKFMNLRALLMTVCFVLLPFAAIAQVTISGTVRETSGEPIIGASVMEKGTSNGAATDLNGNFSFKASSPQATLVVSYVGFESQEVKVAGRRNIVITMKTDDEMLDDVVVVGYGTMKKKLVTGATVQVKGEDIAKLNTTNALTAMQATAPGVNIVQNSTQPGAGFKVNIRGVGTINASSPLLIIDGVQSGTADDGLNGLNPNDIESIDVLKDAASAAIYGARAANGVILVTTKQGKAGKVSVQYDGFVGISNPYKRPALLNAQEYMQIINETNFNTYGTATNWSSLVPASILNKINNGWEGEDWFEQYRNKNAFQQSHAATITGGTDRSKFALSVNYSTNEGIMGGDVASNYKRYGGRINSDHVLLRNSKGRDIITIGENISYWYHRRHSLAEGNGYWNIMHDAYSASPLVPAYDDEGNMTSYSANGSGYNSNIYSQPLNALYAGQYSSINSTKDFGVGATFYLLVEPIKGLKWRSQINTGYSASNYVASGYPFSSSATSQSDNYSVNQNAYESSSLQFENTLSYAFPTFGKHNFDIMIGQSIEQSNWSMGISGNASVSSASVNSLILNGADYQMLNNYDFANWQGGSGYIYPWQGSIASFFGRLNWNYDERFMATATIRADGSSNFAKGHRWGYFPSVSAGWDIAREPFAEGAASWLDQFKIRASWGQNGNCNIDNFCYVSNIGFSPSDYADYGYKFSSDDSATANGNYTTGAYSRNQPNEDVTWETSEQINVGLDAHFLRNRLGLTFDWYQKTTKDWLVEANMQDVFGYEKPAMINAGKVKNTGFEIALSWQDRIGKNFNYHANVNVATNKNKVTELPYGILGNDITSSLFQNSSYVSLVEEGHAIGYFSGMSYSGVWQNQAQIDAARNNGQAVLANAVPGDYIWDDYNGDGVITFDGDRHDIGDPHPNVTLGVNLGFEWKGLDFSVQGYGAFGHQIMQCYRTALLANAYINYTQDVFDRWHGEGTSNTLARLTVGGENQSWVSTAYMQNADYFRIQNITLGYDFAKIWKNDYFDQLRLYVQAQNLYTFTSYTGLDPEIGLTGGTAYSWATGIDLGNYPSPRTYLLGVSIKFADKKSAPKQEPILFSEPRIVEREVVREVPVVKEVVKEVKTNDMVQKTYVVTFEVNSSEIANTNELSGIPAGSTVEVVAYASPEGDADYNIALSQRRADAVADYLRSKGINVERVAAKGADTEHANRIAIVNVIK